MTQAARPTILLVAFPFPPARTVAAVRAWNMAKYLSRLGWDVTVATPCPELLSNPDPAVDIAKACGREGIRRILTDLDLRFLWGDEFLLRAWERSRVINRALRRLLRPWLGGYYGSGWLRPAMRACRDSDLDGVDVIVATASPFVGFEIAQRLAAERGVPYVLDYRDPWMGNQVHRPIPQRLRGPARLEAKWARRASGVMVVSQSWSEALSEQFELRPAPEVISNGFDPDDFVGIEARAFDDFAVVHAGTVFASGPGVSPVLGAIVRANRANLDGARLIRFHYFGPSTEAVYASARKTGALDYTVIHGTVPRRDVLCALKGADVAAIIASRADDGSLWRRGLMTGKLYEAIGAGCRLLLIAPTHSDAAELVMRIGAGCTFDGSQVAEMAQWLCTLRMGRKFQRAYNGSDCSWPAIAARADAFLRRCLDRRCRV